MVDPLFCLPPVSAFVIAALGVLRQKWRPSLMPRLAVSREHKSSRYSSLYLTNPRNNPAISIGLSDALSGFTVLGELGLDGSIAAVAGVLPAAIGANARGEGLICPAACGAEAAWASPEMEIVAAASLIQLANHFRGTQVLAVRSRRSAKLRAHWSTSGTSRARRAPSARSKSPPPAATICSC